MIVVKTAEEENYSAVTDDHQKIPNVPPVQLGVGAAWGLQGIGGQGNQWANNNTVIRMDTSGTLLFHCQAEDRGRIDTRSSLNEIDFKVHFVAKT